MYGEFSILTRYMQVYVINQYYYLINLRGITREICGMFNT